jgi:hypothetical protein
MSKYKIYRFEYYDPRKIGRRKRLLFAVYSVLTPLATFILNTIEQISGSFLLLFLVVLPVTTGLYLFMYYKLKNNQFKTIGEIEFTTTAILKKIGDSSSRYEYRTVKGIELEKHIPAVSAKESKSGFLSYILKISFIDIPSETMIVSDKPIDKRQNLSVAETLKTLKKLKVTEVTY